MHKLQRNRTVNSGWREKKREIVEGVPAPGVQEGLCRHSVTEGTMRQKNMYDQEKRKRQPHHPTPAWMGGVIQICDLGQPAFITPVYSLCKMMSTSNCTKIGSSKKNEYEYYGWRLAITAVQEVHSQHKPISYQYTAIDWVSAGTETFMAVVLKPNRWHISFFF